MRNPTHLQSEIQPEQGEATEKLKVHVHLRGGRAFWGNFYKKPVNDFKIYSMMSVASCLSRGYIRTEAEQVKICTTQCFSQKRLSQQLRSASFWTLPIQYTASHSMLGFGRTFSPNRRVCVYLRTHSSKFNEH